MIYPQSTGGFFSSDLYTIHNIVQNTQILYPKELLISTLREFFAQDSKYHYVQDQWGYPKIDDHTDVNPQAGLHDNEMSRIYIGQEERKDMPFYPNILVKHQSSAAAYVSFNDNNRSIIHETRLYRDGYNVIHELKIPVALEFVGAWDLSFNIEIQAESSHDRTIITEAISMLFRSVAREKLMRAGLFIKNINVDGESSENYQTKSIYKQNVSLECRGEFRRLIPIDNVFEIINVCAEFGFYESPQGASPNMTINFEMDINDIISSL